MGESNYWTRGLRASRLSRRRFVGASATAGFGVAALGLVGCGDDDDEEGGSPTAGSGGGSTPGSGTQPTAVPQALKGGVARYTSANNTWDTFDIQRSIFSTTAAYIHGLTNLGVVQYDNFAEAKLGPAFAQKWEQQDLTQTTFTLRDNLFWHDKAPVNGRAATAEDMARFILRERDATLVDGTVDKSTFYRSSQYALIESVTTPDEKTVVVKFSSPNIFLLDTLAGSYAKIQAPEAIERFEGEWNKLQAESIIGTGAFVLSDFKAEGTLNHRRFDKFPEPANLDGIGFLPLFDQAAGQAAFEQKQIDVFTPAKKAILDDLTNRFKGQLTNYITFSANNGLLLTNGTVGAPWNNPNLMLAISRVLDRRTFVSQFYQGLGGLYGQIPPSQSAFSIKESELITLPGYLEDHVKDVAEGKALWEANGGPALGTIKLDLPDVVELAIPGFSALWVQQMEQLGNKVEPSIVPFSTIISKINTLQYGNTAGGGGPNIYIGVTSDTQGPEPTLGAYQNYHSTQPRAKIYGPADAEVDKITEQAFLEPDVEKRKELMMDFQRRAVSVGGMGLMSTYTNFNNNLAWNYLKRPEWATFVTSHQQNRAWIDTNDPTYEGRPS